MTAAAHTGQRDCSRHPGSTRERHCEVDREVRLILRSAVEVVSYSRRT